MDDAAAAGRTLAETTLDRLRGMILSGELPSGTRLQEKAFADRLGVSRTPVREAIARLVTEGLVTRAQGGVPTVHSLTVTEVIEILHVRRLLEAESARQAALVHSPAEPWIRLKNRLSAFLDGERPTAAAHADLDFDLHMTIARTAGSRLLAEMIEGLKIKTRIYDQGEIPDRFQPGVHEHIAILDAVLARDADAAAAAMRTHIDHTREAILGHIHRLT
ncbi:GntR family transcriptional regulator [Rhodobacteraceae bacterium CCMM004]|nr:GntR family transcriptional regulator [Rhodobacteraceae bacterium CCMM004]